ncbi:MAG: hypothetical protein CM1200mP35_01020 [Chloroflexota bacterium]|nr:MAG: hypothetical protein CM1200mP35_01020 [Chloroflexota bacterium]
MLCTNPFLNSAAVHAVLLGEKVLAPLGNTTPSWGLTPEVVTERRRQCGRNHYRPNSRNLDPFPY